MKPKYDYRQFSRIRRVGQVAFHPKDSSKVYYMSNTRGRQDLWMQTLPESNPKQLTFADEWFLGGFGFSDDGERLIFLAQYQGNERMQMFELPSQGGIPKRISLDKEKRYFPAQNGDLGDNKLLVTTDSFGQTMDVGIMDVTTGEIDMITATDTNYFAGSVSPNKKFAIVGETLSNTHNKLFLMNLETREMELITPDGAVALFSSQSWKADSSGFYFTTDYEREFRAGGFFDLEKREWELTITPEWNVAQILASRDGKWLSYLINERGYTKLHLTNLETGEKIDPDRFPTNGLIFANEFSRDGKYLSYGYEDSSKVADIHVMNLETFEEYVITDNMLGGIDPNDMVHPELVRLTSFEDDKLEFDSFVYKPRELPAGQKVPMMLYIHGGPESQQLPTYQRNGLFQILLDMGIGILAPNIRGSTNYGITFQKLIHRNWDTITGDIKACAEYMKSLDWVDESRLGVWGGSFGGFATLWAVTQLPDYWKIGIDIVGPSNLITFVKAVPPFWKPIMKGWIGDPIEDEEDLIRMSPITYIDQIKATMLIGQGANDPRVVKGESDQIVEKLREKGLDVEYVVYEDEGHGWAKEHNQKDWRKRFLQFIAKQFFDSELPMPKDEFSG